MRKFLVVAALSTLPLVGLGGGVAHADGASNAVNAFRSGSHLYVEAGSGHTLDRSAVEQALSGTPVGIAVLAPGADPLQAARQIGSALSGQRAIAVVSGDRFDAASNLYCTGPTSSLAQDMARKYSGELSAGGGDVTALLLDFTKSVRTLPAQASCEASSGSTSGGGSGGSGVAILVTLLLLTALGGGGYLLYRRRRLQQRLADLRAEVTSYYDRLGSDVATLDPGDNDAARQALADAAARYTATGSQLATAQSEEQFRIARRTALEGLYAARTARTELGLPPGVELPPLYPTSGPMLTQPTTVSVGDQQVQGYPEYHPGAPHWYGGGGGYAAGWYAMPFWETLLVAGAMSSMFGGFGGHGFGDGYREGYQDAQQDSGGGWGGGNDWGGGGGGWGGGGSDWGGSGGWGGGGGGDSGGSSGW